MIPMPHRYLSELLGFPQDLLKTMIILILSICMAPLFHAIDHPKLRKIYALVPGLLFTFYIVQLWGFYVLMVAVIPFIFFKCLPRYAVTSSFALSFFFLLFIHVYRYLYDYKSWKIDCSVTVMYLITKVTYYAYYLNKHKQPIATLQYFSYCFFFPSITVGPAINYEHFKQFINKNQSRITSLNYFLKKLLQAILLMSLSGFLMKIFTTYWIIENQYFISLPFYVQYFSLNLIGVIYRLKYYGAWGFVQVAVDLSGISWDKQSGKFDKVITGSVRFETQLNIKKKTEFWNTSVQIWLKEVVFTTLSQKVKSKTLATLLTFAVSAFWHGIYLTYYLGFIQWAFLVIITKWGYKCYQAKPALGDSKLIVFLSTLVTWSMFNYTGMFMLLLTWDEALQYCYNLKFFGHIMIATFTIVSFVVQPKFLKSKPDPKQE